MEQATIAEGALEASVMPYGTGMHSEYRLFKDGTSWCAVGPGFVNIQESIVGFGVNPIDALSALWAEEYDMENLRRQSIRNWVCKCCGRKFSVRWKSDSEPCPTCKAGAQYTQEDV